LGEGRAVRLLPATEGEARGFEFERLDQFFVLKKWMIPKCGAF
jgi:hypothetical protein